jgi:sugar-phosphatase
MIAAEDVSQGKPHPQSYQTLLKMLGLHPKRCLVFEDSRTGIEAATAAGCDCIGVGPNAKGHPDTKHWIENFAGLPCLAGRTEPVSQTDKRATK